MRVKDTLAASCAGIREAALKDRLLDREADLTAAEENYTDAGASGGLYLLALAGQAGEKLKPDPDGALLRDVYSRGLVARTEGRVRYDELKARAPFGRCLLCGNGEVGALDHHLPKDSLPLYTICPANLVPVCGTCNLAKGNRIGTSPGERTLHPYYDRPGTTGRYLMADVSSWTVQFRIQPLPDWDSELRQRVDHHFRSFKLAERYAEFAVSPLTSQQWLHRSIWRAGGSQALAAHLKEDADHHARTHGPNMWDTALRYGLADSDWYLSGGVNQDL
ncbi:hypothetical protein OHA98_22390 [Streptomyces sp. NBC_00654]|uniref:hypothetical protein n=1 Tax=Streptomyces sp. NBC_00654 TaxID=2975799 RepID=UPI002256535C|nr:hypothetical protein [Streptomyces sp. NBC_00654]MCX4967457.1 hypothetical protein [Streptomyces sp. NBC_00654]